MAGLAPLHAAAEKGDLAAVRRLLGQPGVDVNEEDHRGFPGYGYTPIFEAVIWNRASFIDAFIKAGADPNLSRSNPPLHHAAFYGYLECMDLLIAAGADVNATMSIRYIMFTPMAFALLSNAPSVEAVRRLIAAGADVNVSSGASPLDNAVVENNSFEAIKVLLKAGANPCQPDGGRKMMVSAVVTAHYAQKRRANSPRTRGLLDIIVALMAAGNRCWGELPASCPRLERALPAVWATSPQELPLLFQHLENPVKARMRCTLLLLHRRISEKRVRGKILAATLADEGEAVPLEDWLPDTILDRIRTLDV